MIDMSKAFDTANHALLIDKLQTYRIWEGELLWFKDYLRKRKQRVVMDGAVSYWKVPHAGLYTRATAI